MNVGSTAGFPHTGTILLVMKKCSYTAKTDTSFTITAITGREADNTSLHTGSAGTSNLNDATQMLQIPQLSINGV